MTPKITKADGTIEEFDPAKLQASLERAGAVSAAAEEITRDITKEIKEGMATHEIYHRAFAELREHRREVAARYSLKRAILEFGPSGFPFESYLAELFRGEGYEASIDQHVIGACVMHEVDVVLKRSKESIFVESKFHNTIGFKTDLQVALYVQARLDDIAARGDNSDNGTMRGMIATNTKFTSLAVQYAQCKRLELLGWEYPEVNNLHDRVEKTRLFPITALTTLTHSEKTQLLADRVVLCRDLSRHEDALVRAGVTRKQMDEVLVEAGALCSI